jgi:hypothetical protein
MAAAAWFWCFGGGAQIGQDLEMAMECATVTIGYYRTGGREKLARFKNGQFFLFDEQSGAPSGSLS